MAAPRKVLLRSPKIPVLAAIALLLACLVYFYRVDAAGVLGPDEPRYASIGREMARSGDWITPRLWGQPWFEKPALLYWMTGAAFRLGLGPDLAPRLPVALLSLSFLIFFWWLLRREFGSTVAWLAALILATSAEWIGFSQVGVTDLPMAAAFTAAMLLALPWVARGDTRGLMASGALLGVAVLAKGLVPLALSAPLVWPAWKHRSSLARALPRLALPFAVVCLPWYALCYLRNGPAFLADLIVKQHFTRFASDALQHREPWWFYFPVLAGALLPWTPLLLGAVRRAFYRDPRRLFLLLVVLWGLLLFSASVNKLPGYVVPLLPACAVLMAFGVEEIAWASPLVALSALLLAAFPIAGRMLPGALLAGLSHTPFPAFHWIWLVPLPLAAAAWTLARRHRLAAVALVACGAAMGVVYLREQVMPEVDRVASARPLWRRLSSQADHVCIEPIHRNWRYGLNYYSGVPLPDCPAPDRPIHVFQVPGHPPEVETR